MPNETFIHIDHAAHCIRGSTRRTIVGQAKRPIIKHEHGRRHMSAEARTREGKGREGRGTTMMGRRGEELRKKGRAENPTSAMQKRRSYEKGDIHVPGDVHLSSG